MTKEEIDKQKTGQSSTTPFMKVSQDKCKKSEKGVSFGAIETKETRDRHSSRIDQLTSLVNKLDMKLDRQESQYRPTVYQNRGRGCPQRKVTMSIETGPIVKIGINPTGVEETLNTLTEVTGPTIEIEVDQGIMGMEIAIREPIILKTTEGIIIDRTMVIKVTGIEIAV